MTATANRKSGLLWVGLFLAALGASCSKHRDSNPSGAATAAAETPPPAAGPKPVDCRTCVLGSKHRSCELSFVSAKRDAAKHPVPGSFGCETLDGAAAQAACRALLACINKNHCSMDGDGKGPGDNPVRGCYCGKTDTTQSCLGGTGISGPCLEQYHAAAVATAGGPKPGAAESVFSGFIAPLAFEATNPFGLADNIVTCAIDAPCPSCAGL